MRVLPDSAEPGEEEHGLNLAGGVSLLSLSASCGEQSLAAPRAATVKGQPIRTRLFSIRDFALQSRLVQWNTVKINATYSMEEALALIDQVEPIF
jgi:hypothetical protein